MSLEINSLNRPSLAGIEQLNADAVQGNVPAGAAERPQNAAALPGPDQARLRAAPQVAARQTSLAGRIKTGFQNFGAKVKAFFSRPQETYGLPETLSFSVPGHDGDVSLSREAFLGMIKALPKSERSEAAVNLRNTLQYRIFQGDELVKSILSDPPVAMRNPTAQDIADITLLLMMKAFAAGEGFSRGSLSIEDKDGRIAQYFERSPDLYLRSSTHLEEQQDATVDGHRNAHRGIDFANGPDRGLPFGLTTAVFATIPELKDASGEVKAGRRFFLKPETHGCRISSRSFKAALNPSQYRADFGADTNPRAVKPSDVGAMLKHFGSLIKSKIMKQSSGRREKLPKEFAPLLNRIAEQSPETARKLGIVKDDKDPLKGAGIRSFYAKLDTLASEEVDGNVRSVIEQITVKWPRSTNRERMGDEVMLDRNQLTA